MVAAETPIAHVVEPSESSPALSLVETRTTASVTSITARLTQNADAWTKLPI